MGKTNMVMPSYTDFKCPLHLTNKQYPFINTRTGQYICSKCKDEASDITDILMSCEEVYVGEEQEWKDCLKKAKEVHTVIAAISPGGESSLLSQIGACVGMVSFDSILQEKNDLIK